MIIDKVIMWNEHVEYVSKKMRRNIGVLRRVRNDIPESSLVTPYNTL